MRNKGLLYIFITLSVILCGAIISGRSNEVQASTKVNVKIGDKNFTAALEDNASAKAFAKHLPESFAMSELNGNEKYKYLDYELPENAKKVVTIHAGDIMLYGDDCIVIFYKTFTTSYSYTRLGRIEDTNGLEDAVGDGSVKVSISVKKSRKISLNKASLKLVKGKKYKLKLKNAKANKVKWSSRNKRIASVNKSGRVTAKKKGSTVITAAYGKKKYKCKVTVVGKTVEADTTSDTEEDPNAADNKTDTDKASSVTESTNDKTEAAGEESKTMKLMINGTEIDVLWENNESVRELEQMAGADGITISMSRYGGFEQVGSLGKGIARNDVQMTTNSGDIVLYSGSNVVIFYGSNSWSYTKLGRIVNKTDDELTDLLGGSDVVLTLKMD